MLSVLIAEAACVRVNIYASVMEYWRTRTCLEGVDSRADIVCEEKKMNVWSTGVVCVTGRTSCPKY
jgi:hypothetical protein